MRAERSDYFYFIRASAYKIRFVALLLFSAPSVLAASNLIADGGFEQNWLSWSSPKSILSLDSAAAFSGLSGLKLLSSTNYCKNDALYTLDAHQFQQGTLYEFGARTRLEAGAPAAKLRMALIKNDGDPLYLDGYASSSYAYSDRWTRLFGVNIANLAATDSLKLCISGAINTATYIDDVYVRPLTTKEIGYQAPSSLNADDLLQAEGNRLVLGHTQKTIILNGINLSAYNYGNDIAGAENAIDNFSFKNHDEDSYREISELGYNAVRLMMSFVFFEDNAQPGIYKEEGWAWLERNILWAKKYNIRLILDLHEPPGGAQLSNFHDFSSRPDIQKRLENLWLAIAQRYRNETSIAAYDLINEPYVDHWFLYAQGLIGKIRAVDPNHLVLIEQSYHPNDLGNNARLYPLPFANIIYDTHYYDTFASSDAGTAPYTGTLASFKANLRNDLSPFYDSAKDEFRVPINIGEYGVVHQKFEKNLGAEQWLRNITDAMNDYGISRQLFNYHESRFGIYSGWNTYVGESTSTNTRLKSTLQELNHKPLPAGADTLPDAFSFVPQTAATPKAEIESLPVTLSGIDAPTPITIFGGSYRTNNGPYTSLAGWAHNGDSVQVKHTAATTYQTGVSSQFIIGGISGVFTSTTQDITPNPFSFIGRTKVALNTPITSAEVIVSGIDALIAISVVGGEYSINGAAYTALPGSVKNGDSVKLRQLSSASYASKVTTTLKMGALSGAFSSTTATQGTTFNQLSISAAGSGSGKLAEPTGSIDCASASGTLSGICSARLASGATLALSATPASGSRFAGWSGACSGASPSCALTMDAAKSVLAAFSTLAVSTSDTTLSVSTHPNFSQPGESVPVTVIVTPLSIGGTLSGTVEVRSDGQACTLTLPETSCRLLFVGKGAKRLAATYSGNAFYTAGTGSATHYVGVGKRANLTPILELLLD